MNILETLPFVLDCQLSAQSMSYQLNIMIKSREQTPESIEVADEMVDIFARAVNNQQFTNTWVESPAAFNIIKRKFNNHTFAYDIQVDQLPLSAYTVLITLWAQATLLEEPIETIVMHSHPPNPGPVNFNQLAEHILSLPVPPDHLPYELEWNDPDTANHGFDITIEFAEALTDANRQSFEEMLFLWDNILWMYGFQFDLDAMDIYYPDTGNTNQISPTTITYMADMQEDDHAMIFLFNWLTHFHLNVQAVASVSVD